MVGIIYACYHGWLILKQEWIKYRHSDENAGDSTGKGPDDTVSAVAMSKNDPRSQFIPVPSENDMPCGICQEKFVPSWNEQLQDFVWMDAVRVGDKIYHASCWTDFRKDEGGTPARTSTPDSVLGKRKADVSSRSRSFLTTKY
jgi:pre-mRNA cleavage complex 2 protein Pcf11